MVAAITETISREISPFVQAPMIVPVRRMRMATSMDPFESMVSRKAVEISSSISESEPSPRPVSP